MLSERIDRIKGSATLAMFSKIEKLKKERKSIINFAIGEPDLRTPPEVIEASQIALHQGKTRYSNPSGLPELKNAISEKLRNENKLDYPPDQIIISNGAKQCLYQTFETLCIPGDEVLLPVPYWPSLIAQIRLAGAKPVFLPPAWTKNPSLLDTFITNKTKALVINSPNNPSGQVYGSSFLRAVGERIIKHNLYLISDETYEKYVYEGEHCSPASLSHELKKRTVSVWSFSKTYSMTGFRIGYMAGPAEIISQINKLQSHTTGNVCTFSQYGALAALKMDQKKINRRVALYKKRRDLIWNLAKTIFPCEKPGGAFYIFPRVKEDEQRLADKLLARGIAAIPGRAFGAHGYLRFSFTLPEKNIKQGFCIVEELV